MLLFLWAPFVQAATEGRVYLMTNSESANVTRLHILNSSISSQSFTGTLYNGSGEQLGNSDVALHSGVVASQGRLILSASDLEQMFETTSWSGPALLHVKGESEFDLMTKLTSPSGLVSNTNCVRENRVHNIEGFDSASNTFVRFINTSSTTLSNIVGTIVGADGNAIGNSEVTLLSSLAPNAAVFLNRADFAEMIGSEWSGVASLELVGSYDGLKLLNLNFVNEETFFNFSCFESQVSSNVYLMTNSVSNNVSATHLVNTSEEFVTFSATAYSGTGGQLGAASSALHTESIAPGSRLVVSAEDIETSVGTQAWSGPALIQIQSTGTNFELMTKLASPSGLISNTNCVRQNDVHNIEGFDSPNNTFVRFINAGDSVISNVTGTLYDTNGSVLGNPETLLFSELAAKSAEWINRAGFSSIFGVSWEGEATLIVGADNSDDLRLLNLNFVNDETFFNFSCYESSEEDVSSLNDPNSTIQTTMALPEVNCTNSSCHDATPGAARLNLLTGTLEDFVTRLVDQPSESPSCNGEKLIDSENPENSLLLKLIDADSGQQCIGKMPFGGTGVSEEYFLEFNDWVNQLVESATDQPVADESVLVEPMSGFSALTRAKYVLHGGAVTDEDYDLSIDSQGDLNIDGLRSAISSWFDSPAFERKMLAFLGTAFHQDANGPIVPEYYQQLGVTWGGDICTVRPEGLYSHDAMEVVLTEIVPRTAYRLIEQDLDFRTIATTNQIVTNTIGLYAFALADNPRPEDIDLVPLGYNLCQFPDLTLEDFNDWRMVELNQQASPANFEPLSQSYVASLRSIPEGGSFGLKANRNGICNSFSFFANFPTNESNQYRLNVSQCMIATLGHIFEAGDTTPTNSLDGLDTSHIDPTTECFGCHQHLDPMAQVYRGQYNLNHQVLDTVAADNNADFSFQGHARTVSSMAEFNAAISTHPDFAMGIAVKLCQWATSQACSRDDPNMQAVVADFVASGYQFKQLVLSMFTSPLLTTIDQTGVYAETGSNISTTRAQHMCLALETRMERQLQSDRLDDSQPDPKVCQSQFDSTQAAMTIPRDLFQRGYPDFIQASTISLLTPKLFEPLCDAIRHPVMQAFDAYHVERTAETLDGFTQIIVGVPESSSNYSSARQSLQVMYDVARAPSCGSVSSLQESLTDDQSCGFDMDHSTAMSFVFRNVCLAPATTSIGM